MPKYRKHILGGEVLVFLKEVFKRISEEYGFKIDVMEVVEDHIHVFLEAPPKYSGAVGTNDEKHIGQRGI